MQSSTVTYSALPAPEITLCHKNAYKGVVTDDLLNSTNYYANTYDIHQALLNVTIGRPSTKLIF